MCVWLCLCVHGGYFCLDLCLCMLRFVWTSFELTPCEGGMIFCGFSFFLFFSFLTVFLESNNILKVRRFKELNFEQLWEFLDCLFCQMVKFWEKSAQVNIYIYGCTWEVNKKKNLSEFKWQNLKTEHFSTVKTPLSILWSWACCVISSVSSTVVGAFILSSLHLLATI